ncbi:hypothetical protein Vretifemale_431 [Volvox reticuliferus]|uniref:Uncharacterized protein n=1 Tax=Volvox reticuliferus TaxID=1737510 RepID=A0A8J4C198_9CHLO|nr:hypothetical protein Vretifemale_431 [Volvox reticuliferus]
MNVSMDLVLDEAESAFLQAILTGTEAGPVFDVARGLEVPSTQLNSYIVPDALSSAFGAQGADAATLRVDGPGVPTSHAIQSLQPYNKPPSYCTAHAIYRSPVTSESSIAVQKRQPWQQDLLPPGRAAESQSCIASVTSGQQPQSDLLQNQTLRQQEINSRAASPRVHKGALFAIHAAIATAATNDPSGDGRLSPTAPTGCHQPCVTQLQLCGGTPAPGSLAATAPPACTSTSSMPALSNTDSAISAVSEPSALAKKRTPPTESVCMLHGRRRWSSANLGTAPRGGVSAGSSSSRSFSSAAAIPCASNFAAAAASVMKGSRSASASSTAAVTTAAVPPTAPPSRRTHGLLEHIQNLEAQLTELLLATSDCDEAESNPLGPTAGSAVSASAGMCAAQRHGLPAEAASRLTDPSGPNDRPTDLNHNVHRQQHGKTPCLRNGPWHPHQVVVRLAAGGSVGNPQAAYYSRRQLLVFSVAEQLCRDYNSSGVALMEAGLDEAAREQLDKALLLAGPKGPLEGRTEKQRELQIVAHNNLACYYRKLGQPSLALQHLQHTARLEAAAAAATDPTEGSAEGGLLSAHYVAGAEGNGGGGGGGGSDGVGTGGGGGADGGDVLLAGLGPGRGPTAATLLNLAACSSSLGQHTQALSYATRALQSAAGELQVRPHKVAASAALLFFSIAVSVYGPGW